MTTLAQTTTTLAETTTQQEDTDRQTLYPGVFIPTYGQALELTAVELERQSGREAAEELWNMSADPEEKLLVRQDYNQAVADHLAHWGTEGNSPVAQRMALLSQVRQEDQDDKLPPGWTWPVCDDCTMMAYDMGQKTAIRQAAFMQEFGRELPDHLCEMALSPEDRGRDSCGCGCRKLPGS